MFKEFKEFALKGNVMDLAVGVIIGAAFGKIVDSIVADMIMPLVGKVIGTVDFSNMYLNLTDDKVYPSLVEAKKAGANLFAYGNFITILVNFLILAFVIFLLVKGMNNMKRAEVPPPPPPPPGPTPEQKLLGEIRDLLAKR